MCTLKKCSNTYMSIHTRIQCWRHFLEPQLCIWRGWDADHSGKPPARAAMALLKRWLQGAYTYLRIHICTYIHIFHMWYVYSVLIHIRTRIHTPVHTHTHTYILAHIFTRIFTHKRERASTLTQANIHIRMCTKCTLRGYRVGRIHSNMHIRKWHTHACFIRLCCSQQVTYIPTRMHP
jgi:hypothetical protein